MYSPRYSTECYRDFFLDAALVPFMSRSVDILEELARRPRVRGFKVEGKPETLNPEPLHVKKSCTLNPGPLHLNRPYTVNPEPLHFKKNPEP